MKLNPLLIVLILFLFPSSGFAQVDLEEANKFLEHGKYLDALKIVAPCLDPKLNDKRLNLEYCLYIGENIAEKAISELTLKRNKVLDAFDNTRYPNYREGVSARREMINELEAQYLELGIAPFYNGSMDTYFYRNEFFKLHNELFPNSDNRAEVKYKLIDKSANVNIWKEWNRSLESFVREFPNSKYTINAKLDLAHNYDDLWNLTHPDHDWSFLVIDFPKDKNMADEYKQKALNLYKEILEDTNSKFLNSYDINDTQKRIIDLNKGVQRKGIGILRGYD